MTWDGVTSEEKTIRAGVPQGSVLGPTLFNLYMMDFPKDDNWLTRQAMYADDVALLARSKNWSLAKEYSQEKLDNSMKWYRKWRLELNVEKTQVVPFYRQHSFIETGSCLRIGQQPIEWSRKATYLGIMLNSNLSMEDHNSKIIGRSYFMKTALSPILNNKMTPNSITAKMYDIYIRPSVLYAAPCWVGLITEGRLKRMEVTERNCLRTICKIKPWAGNDTIYKMTKISPLREVVKKDQAKYFEKLSSSGIPELKILGNPKTFEGEKYKRPERRVP